MKKYCVLLLLLLISLHLPAQHIRSDIFGDLQYESKRQGYKATLKKDIFNNLVFSDNNNNELSFNTKYLDLYHKAVLEDEEARKGFFRQYISSYISERGYKATFEVDILDKVIIKDNLNSKVEIGTDIFGNPTYERKWNNEQVSIKRDLSGNLEYRSGNEQASLKKDIFNKWSYSDSSGNKFEFSKRTWDKLSKRYVSEEDVFLFLIHQFFYF